MSEEEQIKCIKDFFLNPSSYPFPVTKIEHLETHISDIFLTGKLAYKIKKRLNLKFLDFSSLKARKYFTERELLLNKRYAPHLYKEVIPLFSCEEKISFSPMGEVCDYALLMNQFDGDTLFSSLCDKGKLSSDHIRGIVDEIVSFHKIAEKKPDYWSFEVVSELSEENILALKTYAFSPDEISKIKSLEILLTEELLAKKECIKNRQSDFVKELHGDLHLGNICIFESKPTLFDGLEFNEKYNCIDTWADFAFLTMDLGVRGKSDLRTLAINTYLECTDDFEGLTLLRLYESYRASVRAKVASISLHEHEEKQIISHSNVARYLSYADNILQRQTPKVFCIGGLSGSGKSTLAKALSLKTNAVIIRSDAVRKHLSKIPLMEKATQAAYSKELTDQVYDEMLKRSLVALKEGFSVILDATFLKFENRERTTNFFLDNGFSLNGYWCEVPIEIALQRIKNRKNDISDADESVLKAQYNNEIGEVNWQHVNMTQDVEIIMKTLTFKNFS